MKQLIVLGKPCIMLLQDLLELDDGVCAFILTTVTGYGIVDSGRFYCGTQELFKPQERL